MDTQTEALLHHQAENRRYFWVFHLVICEDSLKLGLLLSTVGQDGTGVNETDTMVNRAWDLWLSSPQHHYLTKDFDSFHLEPSCPVGHGQPKRVNRELQS